MVRWSGFGFNGHNWRDRRREISVSLLTDEDGMIGRECTKQDCNPKYFKISMKKVPESHKGNLSNSQLYCPYCRNLDHMQSYRTKAQTDYVVSLAKREIVGELNKMFSGIARDFNRSVPRGGLISISMEVKPASLPIIQK